MPEEGAVAATVKRAAGLLVALALLIPALPAHAATPTVTEFSDGIPTAGAGGAIFGIAAGSDGKLWFADQGSNNTLGSINPFNQILSEVTPAVANGIFGITNGPDGNLYYGEAAAFGNNSIGGIIPATAVHRFTFLGGGNPAWPRFTAIGPEGNIWATEPRNPADTTDTTVPGNINHKDKVSFSTPHIDTAQPDDGTHGPIVTGEVALPANGFNSDPETIAAGPGDTSASPSESLWVPEFTANRIARVTPFFSAGGEGASVTEYAGLSTGAKPEGIALGPDGNIWFTEFGANKVGRLIPPASSVPGHENDPPTALDEFPLPAGSAPFGIAAGPDGNLWIAETGTGKITRMTTAGVVTGDFQTPGEPSYITAGADGNMWFGDLAGAVGRITTALDPPAFRNPNPVTIPTVGTTNPPSTVNVSGLQGTVTRVTARLTGISHTFPDDLNILLEGPQGQTVMLMSDVGSAVGSRATNKTSYPADGITLNFSDTAPRKLSDTDPLVSGFYKPTNVTDAAEGAPPEMDSPAPLTDTTTPFSTSLGSFNGTNPNGTWTLWITDDNLNAKDIGGKIYGGWGLDIKTTGPPKTPQTPQTPETPAIPATPNVAPAAAKCKKKKHKRSAASAKKCKKKKK